MKLKESHLTEATNWQETLRELPGELDQESSWQATDRAVTGVDPSCCTLRGPHQGLRQVSHLCEGERRFRTISSDLNGSWATPNNQSVDWKVLDQIVHRQASSNRLTRALHLTPHPARCVFRPRIQLVAARVLNSESNPDKAVIDDLRRGFKPG
jgi:hypothetical protein